MASNVAGAYAVGNSTSRCPFAASQIGFERGRYTLLVKVVGAGGIYDQIFSPRHHKWLDFKVR